jgi:diadenosine tetraphosphatase ApaH/serine/threonine PP2A family protein phosphatase
MLDRFKEIGYEDPMCDLIWSSPDDKKFGWVKKHGYGYKFGPDVTKTFNYVNGLNMIVRSDKIVDEVL